MVNLRILIGSNWGNLLCKLRIVIIIVSNEVVFFVKYIFNEIYILEGYRSMLLEFVFFNILELGDVICG